jgi:hypothetical protein
MPITLNHSNIGVQYNTGSNYIIETVKSDLYLRNEIYNTIVSNNLQAAPVTPIVYIENTSNIYAVESYTYSGSANTADYTRVFPKNTTCDILIVGGGGGGGYAYVGGGGGGGGYVYLQNVLISTGSCSIKVGGGGADGVNGASPAGWGSNGNNSSITGIINYIALGGGGGAGGSLNGTITGIGNNGGSGGGGSYRNISQSAAAGGTSTQLSTYGYGSGGSGNSYGSPWVTGGGGGGASGTTNGTSATGNNGLSNSITGTSITYAGGGGGGVDGSTPSSGGTGGGGGGANQTGTLVKAVAGTDGLGGGGGGSASGAAAKGGSGIIIIRYLVGTIPTNNLLTTAPIVSPNIYPVKTNVFTHSGGTEAQTSYTINFPNNTICDILMIGGGGGGGKDRAGGGGAGALILSIGNILSAGTYTISVGKGSLGATTGVNAVNGYDCEIVNSVGTVIYRAKGGGGGQSLNDPNASTGGNAPDGGCGGGKVSQFTGLGGNVVSTNIVGGITTGPVVTTTYGVYGKDGGRNITGWNGSNGGALDGAGGGGIGEGGSDTGSLVAVDSQFVATNGGKGGDGLYFATINGIVYNFKNYFNVEGIQDGTTGNFFIGGGGGGGDANEGVAGIGGKGGGGAGGESSVIGVSATGFGSGGGGGGASDFNGGNGSAGIVVIRVREGYFTESTRMFVHNGSSDSQSTYNINIPEDTICDMLIVAGGGGGGMDMGGGGGGGGVIELNNVLVTAGTYTIKVGKGGDGAPAAGTNGQPSGHPFKFNGKQGSNSSFDNYVAIGGGYGGTSHHSYILQGQGGDGGSGGGSSGYEPVNNVSKAGKGVEGQGFRGGYGGQSYYSGGGGGAGEVGGGPSTAAGGAYGGRGKLSNIIGTPYYWAGGGGGSGYSTTGGNGGLGGGGGGAVGTTTGGTGYFNGFAGGGGTTNAQTNTPGGNGAPHTGGGGGGGSHYTSNNKGGDGGSGIVIIKLKSLSKIGKTADTKILNFAYDPVISFDPGKRAEYQAQLKTGVGGWRIVRFLPATSTTSWYPISDNLTGTTLSGISYSYTNYWTVPFGTFDEFVFATLNMNYWLYCTKTTAYASYNNTAANIIKSSFSSTPYTALWFNRGTASPEDPLISIQNYGTQVVYAENGANNNPKDMIPLDGGMCVLVRDSTASTLVPSTTYTLNFPVPTLTNINTINNVVLEGEYDITINNNSSSIVSKTGKHIPKFASSISAPTIGISYNLLKPVIDPIGAQWTYNSSNINVYHMGSVGIGTTIPEYSLDVRGTIYSSLGGYTSSALTKWSVLSDRRIKENIVKASYDKCLENVKNIELYNFNFKDNCVNTNDRRQLGFIAQEVQQVYPKAVEVSKMILNLEERIDDLLTLNITQIDYTLYGAVKSLIEKMENIKIKMEQIKTAYDIP